MAQDCKKGLVHVTTTTIGKWGNSMGVRIPQEFLETAHLGVGTKVEIQLIPEQGILLKPMTQSKRKSNRELRKLLLSMRGKNKSELSQGILIDDSVGDEMF
ncbi:AbrB/MazE/SpoVT family DNA-binding domain-containing protein [Paenibacillus konkukensis]|uniref:AbrB/MazE/SpoVT family DNA-binding domain-containing protein n=1 Tax=Paenibacillus konkukensis TaxID=2020716 RepID=UPI00201D6916|nr:AbrB/MazE/SpoVT family DNA-binding domain-containing protein [Paenibacillus konkukensis]